MHRTVLVVDVEGFGDRRRTNPQQAEVREGLYRVLREAFRDAGIAWADCYHEDRGDGVFVLAPSDVPKGAFVERLPAMLVEALGKYNAAHSAKERIRLRMALHAGEVNYDDHGVVGTAINLAFRLIEAPPFKNALANSPGALALIVSSWFFDEVVRHSTADDPATYRQIPVQVKETTTVGWICLPDHPFPPDPTSLDLSATGPRAVVPRQLPAAPRLFTGRAKELDQLTTALERLRQLAGLAQQGGTVVISAIGGTGGIGKTWLALHWAHRTLHRFPDGQLFVNLRGFDPVGEPMPSGTAVRGFLDALGVEPGAIPVDPDTQVGLYRSLVAGKRMLIVLDNAHDANHVIPLLPGASTVAVVITSRHQLGGLVTGYGALPLALDVLGEGEARELLVRQLGAAQAVASADAVTELLRCCAGLPLALGIVAARAASQPHLPLEVLAEELREASARLDALDAGDPTANLRAVFSCSYQALSAEASELFRLLGLAPGPDISLPAVAALGGVPIPRARMLLRELTSTYLVQEHVPGRYRMHDLVRLYAADTAAQERPDTDIGQAMGRLLEWYLRTADAADSRLTAGARRLPLGTPRDDVEPLTFTGHRVALAWCEVERTNLVAATHYAAEHGLHGYAWRLPTTSWGFLNLRKHWADWLSTHEIALVAARTLGDLRGEAWTLCGLGLAYVDTRSFDRAVDCFERALEVSRAAGDLWGEGWALGNLASAYRGLGRFEEAVGFHERARDIARDTRDRWGEGWALHGLANALRGLGRLPEALDCGRLALAVRRDAGDRWGEGWTLHTLGNLHAGLHQPDEAMTCYRRALVISREMDDRWSEVRILHKLGQTSVDLHRLTDATDYYRQALSRRRELGDQWGVARILVHLGSALHGNGESEEAEACWGEALAILGDIGDAHVDVVRASIDAVRRG